MTILITGGGGFIGSHTCVELLCHGYDVVVVDNFANSWPRALTAVRELTGREFPAYPVDIRDEWAMGAVLAAHDISAVVHFAAKKSVAEPTIIPLDYFDVNVGGIVSLLRVMRKHRVTKLVFSSSCSVYDDRYDRAITEDYPPGPVNSYALSKLICDQMIESACATYTGLHAISLRYFNPAGAHPSGSIGESPRGAPSNVVPVLTAVAAGQIDKLSVFDTDYPANDGSVSVRYETTGRRPGDVARLVADATRIKKEWS